MHIFLRLIFALFVGLYGWTWFDFDFENFKRVLLGDEVFLPHVSPIASFQRTGLIDNVFDNCKLEVVPTWTSELKRLLNPLHDPLKNCNRSFIPWSELGLGGRVRIRNETPSEIECRAREIVFKNEFKHAFGRWHDVNEGNVFENDIVEVECQLHNVTVYNFLHHQIWESGEKGTKPSDIKEEPDRNQVKNDEKNKTNDQPPSVYIVVVDSIGASHGRRVFPQTLRFLKEEFGAVEMMHTNKVGENSRPNGIAFLFGKSITNIKRNIYGLPPLPADWNVKEFCKRHLDGRGFILQQFEKKGYKTMMAEDWHQGVFNWPSCYGFKRQPTTHYMRPFQLRLNKDHAKVLRDTMSEGNCMEHHHHLNGYMEQFMRAYNNSPKIALTWASYLGHDSANLPFHADLHYKEFFERNKEELDNSFLFFMGDHGLRFGKLRWTPAGQRDINNPMLIVSVPKRLRGDSTLIANLKKNSQELLTMFDLHATLLDISESSFTVLDRSNYSEIVAKEGLRASSFLRPLPSTLRNCKTLPIPPQFCLCKIDKEKEDITDELSSSIGSSIALAINGKLTEWNVTQICEYSKPVKVINLQRIVGADELYEATVIMKPGGGNFQTFVRRDFNSSSFSVVVPDVTRLDKYGRQGDCTDKNEIRPLCYCKNQRKIWNRAV